MVLIALVTKYDVYWLSLPVDTKVVDFSDKPVAAGIAELSESTLISLLETDTVLDGTSINNDPTVDSALFKGLFIDAVVVETSPRITVSILVTVLNLIV